MACKKSKMGRNKASTVSFREAKIPSGMATNTVMATATITWLSVSMLLSHMPMRPMSASPAAETRARRHPPASQATAAVRSMIAAQGRISVRRERRGFSMRMTTKSLKGPVPMGRSPIWNRLSLIQVTVASTGWFNLMFQASGNSRRSGIKPAKARSTRRIAVPASRSVRGRACPTVPAHFCLAD